VRTGLVRLSVAVALVAVVLGAWRSWPHLSDERAHLTDAAAERAAAVHEGLPVERFDAMKARVDRGETWWVDVPEGRAEGLTTRGAVYRTYALYWLLPALPASSRSGADEVFRLRPVRVVHGS
jgi:hypothetical protein